MKMTKWLAQQWLALLKASSVMAMRWQWRRKAVQLSRIGLAWRQCCSYAINRKLAYHDQEMTSASEIFNRSRKLLKIVSRK